MPTLAIMTNIIQFKIPKPKQKHKGKTLCKNGLHKWEIVTERRFDVHQGGLVTEFRCQRCGKTRIKAL